MFTAKELFNYRDEVRNAAKGEKSAYFFNDSILHAMLILKNIFDGKDENASKSNTVVRMYCGTMSLFRQQAKNEAANAKNVCVLDIEDDELRSEWGAWDLWQELRKSLENYLTHEGRLEIILDDVGPLLKDADLTNLLSKKGRVVVRKLTTSLGLPHVTTSEIAYRIEDSHVDRTATCAFNDRDTARSFINSFDAMKQFTVPVYFS